MQKQTVLIVGVMLLLGSKGAIAAPCDGITKQSNPEQVISCIRSLSENIKEIESGPPGPQGPKGEKGERGEKGLEVKLLLKGEYRVKRSKQKGTSTKDLIDLASGFCYLTEVSIEETDTQNESASCKIVQDSRAKKWVLKAILGKGGGPDTTAICGAYCIAW